MATADTVAVTETGGSAPTGRRAAAASRAEDRGSLSIEDRVVEKMAAHVIDEVDDVGGAARRWLGVPAGRDDPDRSPQVRARVDGVVCSLQVRLSVGYPASVTRVTEQVRAHVTAKLRELAGLQVKGVDIIVTALHPPHGPGRVIR
jgi:uncharacterized alkaline shock family protein YloU